MSEQTPVAADMAAPVIDPTIDPTIVPDEAPPMNIDRSPDLAQRVFDRMTKTGAAALQPGREILPRRVRRFILDGAVCLPDTFVDAQGNYIDFEVTMRSLSSKEEIAAVDGIENAHAVPFALARASFHAINGKPLDSGQKEFFWEAFGMGGRQICLAAFQQVGSATGIALGKFRSTVSAQ
jgi:hypothetical protein